jgi:AraC family transcriptional regulator
LGKIAVALQEALKRRRERGEAGRAVGRTIAAGQGWSVGDVTCTSGPQDRSFEERHTRPTIAIVLAGTFQYRSPIGRGFMAPGSLLLGNAGHCYECGHRHGEGDRCVAFYFQPDYFERLAADAGARGANLRFPVPRLPPMRPLATLVARTGAGAIGAHGVPWEEVGVRLAVGAVKLAAGLSWDDGGLPMNAEVRVTRAVRAIDERLDGDLSLGTLARESGLSPYHFLRTFERLTGVTPHQYVLRARLRAAATRLATEAGRVIDVALDAGFGDISNFNRAFRTEFGASPRAYRQGYGTAPPNAR